MSTNAHPTPMRRRHRSGTKLPTPRSHQEQKRGSHRQIEEQQHPRPHRPGLLLCRSRRQSERRRQLPCLARLGDSSLLRLGKRESVAPLTVLHRGRIPIVSPLPAFGVGDVLAIVLKGAATPRSAWPPKQIASQKTPVGSQKRGCTLGRTVGRDCVRDGVRPPLGHGRVELFGGTHIGHTPILSHSANAVWPRSRHEGGGAPTRSEGVAGG